MAAGTGVTAIHTVAAGTPVGEKALLATQAAADDRNRSRRLAIVSLLRVVSVNAIQPVRASLSANGIDPWVGLILRNHASRLGQRRGSADVHCSSVALEQAGADHQVPPVQHQGVSGQAHPIGVNVEISRGIDKNLSQIQIERHDGDDVTGPGALISKETGDVGHALAPTPK
jgi:hypothetical protein